MRNNEKKDIRDDIRIDFKLLVPNDPDLPPFAVAELLNWPDMEGGILVGSINPTVLHYDRIADDWVRLMCRLVEAQWDEYYRDQYGPLSFNVEELSSSFSKKIPNPSDN